MSSLYNVDVSAVPCGLILSFLIVNDALPVERRKLHSIRSYFFSFTCLSVMLLGMINTYGERERFTIAVRSSTVISSFRFISSFFKNVFITGIVFNWFEIKDHLLDIDLEFKNIKISYTSLLSSSLTTLAIFMFKNFLAILQLPNNFTILRSRVTSSIVTEREAVYIQDTFRMRFEEAVVEVEEEEERRKSSSAPVASTHSKSMSY
jgi:hypothetical protein